MSTITWLHLSDLHFRAGEGHTWDRDIVLRKLVDDVETRITEDHLRPDFIAITGDIAFSGKAEEYELARQFFDELLQVTAVPRTRLFVAPGNHDVDRAAITRGASAIASALDSREAVAEVLAADTDRRVLFQRLDAYARFVNDYFSPDRSFTDEAPFVVQSFDVAGRRLAVLALSSAWLARGGDEDRGRLVIGERQVRQAIALRPRCRSEYHSAASSFRLAVRV